MTYAKPKHKPARRTMFAIRRDDKYASIAHRAVATLAPAAVISLLVINGTPGEGAEGDGGGVDNAGDIGGEFPLRFATRRDSGGVSPLEHSKLHKKKRASPPLSLSLSLPSSFS